MKIVSVILARGGSKGIPKKNIIDIYGKPLLWYTINTSLNSDVHETWVSTDDKEIKDVSLNCGAKVLDRPKELSTCFSQSDDALVHFANNVDFDLLVFIQPTSPLVKSVDINGGLSLIGKYDSVFSGYREEWSSRWSSEMKTINWDGKNRPRRQDVENIYIENGAFYITSKKQLLKSGCRYSGKIGVSEMAFYQSFQIDTFEDLKFIRKII